MVKALHQQKYTESADDAYNDFDNYGVDGTLWFRSGFAMDADDTRGLQSFTSGPKRAFP